MARTAPNIEIITRFEQAFRAADQPAIDELADPGLVDHNPAPGHEPTLAGFKQKVAGFKRSSSTWRKTCRTSSPAATPSPPGGS
jgi:hypothetical protein